MPPAEAKRRIRAALAAKPDGFRSVRQVLDVTGGNRSDALTAFRELVEAGEVITRDGRYVNAPDAKLAARKRPSPAKPEVAPELPDDEEALPGSTATVAGLAEIYDYEIAETRKTIRVLRKAARNGDPAPNLPNHVRTLSELVRRRRELVADHDAVTLLPDAQLDQEILDGAREVVSAAIGVHDPERIAFAVMEPGGGFRLVPYARVVAELGRRHTAARE